MAFSLARTLPLLAVSRGSRRKGKSGNSGKHQVLSPLARGLLLVPVFILWIGLSGWFETSKLSVGPEFQSRSKYSNRNKAEKYNRPIPKVSGSAFDFAHRRFRLDN